MLPGGVNLEIFSENATMLELCCFNSRDFFVRGQKNKK